MVPTTKTKAVYAAIVLLVQLYVVYAATLYVEVGSAGFLCILCAAGASAAGANLYLFVLGNEDERVPRQGQFMLDERRRLG
jgi:hypothetical protein